MSTWLRIWAAALSLATLGWTPLSAFAGGQLLALQEKRDEGDKDRDRKDHDDKDKRAKISITAPATGTQLSSAKIDVAVSFSSGKGEENEIHAIDLTASGHRVAFVALPKSTKSGTHVFKSIDLTSFANPGKLITLVARAFLEKEEKEFVSSDPVLVTLVTDHIPPGIVIQSPVNGSKTKNPKPPVSAMVTDTGGSGVDPATIVVHLDGSLVAATVTLSDPNTASVSFAPSSALSQGPHSATVDAKDHAGNAAAQATSSFIIDLTPPIASISSPVNGSFGKTPIVPLVAQVTDAGGSGVSFPSIVATLDGGTIMTGVTMLNPNQVSVSFTPPSALSEGPHTYTLIAKDLAGNVSALAVSSFTIDLTPPVLTLAPASGQRVQGPTPPLTVTYSDTLSGVDLTTLKITLDGTDVTANFTVAASQAAWAAASPLADGPHILRAQVADNVGNLAQTSSLFRTDSGLGTVGSLGGTVTVPSSGGASAGAALVFPPGALSQNTTFFIEVVSAPTPFPSGYSSVGPVLDFGPSTVFAQPVTIEVPYNPAAVAASGVPPSGLRLLTFDTATGLWILVPVISVDTVNHLLVAEITQLSGQQFGVAAPTVSPTQTLVGVPAGGVVADGLSFTTLTITPEASDGSLIGPNETVTATVTGIGTPAVQIIDLGNGVYQIFVSSSVTGSAQVSITVNGVTLPVQTVTFTPVPSSFAITGFTSPLQAGVPSDVTLRALDQNGNTLTTFTGSVELDLAGTRDGSENLIYPDSFVATFSASDAGQITLPGALVFAQAGQQQVKVLYLLGPVASGSASVQVTAGPPALITKIGGDNQSGAAGTTLPQPLAVRVTDLFGNPVAGVQVRFNVQTGSAAFVQ